MNNYFRRLLSMIVAATMIISSFSSAFAGNFVVTAGTDEVVSGSAIDIASFSSDPISEEAVFAPDRDANVSSYELPAVVTGYYSMNKITLLASNSQPASIDTGWYAYEDGSYEYAARTLAPSSDLGGVIAFATEGAAKVKVNAVAQASDSLIGIIEGMPTSTVTGSDMIASQTGVQGVATTYEFSVLMGGQYAIAATAGFDFSEVVVTPLAEDDLVISGQVEDSLTQVNATSENLWLASEELTSTKLTGLGLDTTKFTDSNKATVRSNNSDNAVFNPDIWNNAGIAGQTCYYFNSNEAFTFTPTVNGNLSLYMIRYNNNSAGTVNITSSDSSVTLSSQTISGRQIKDNFTPVPITFDVVSGVTYTVTSNNDGDAVFGIDFVTTGGSTTTDPAPTATVTIADGTSTGTVKIAATDSGAEVTADNGTYTLTADTGYTITATPANTTDTVAITGEGATITDNGNGTATFTAPTTGDVAITVTFTAQSTTPVTGTEIKEMLDFSNLTSGSCTNNTELEDSSKKFIFQTGTSSQVVDNTSSKTAYSLPEGYTYSGLTTYTPSKYIYFGGSNSRYVRFKLASDGYLVVGTSTTSSNRPLNVAPFANGAIQTTSAETILTTGTTATNGVSSLLTGGTEYALYSGDSGMYINYIGTTSSFATLESTTTPSTATATFNTMTNGTAVIEGVTATDGVYTLTQGTAYTVTATPVEGYELDTITATGATVSGTTITPTADTVTITVTFKEAAKKTYATIPAKDIVSAGTEQSVTYNFLDGTYTGQYIGTTKSTDSIYAMTDNSNNYVIVDGTTGLTIVDGDANSNAAYIPYGDSIPTNGKLTISGTAGVTANNDINIFRFSGTTSIRQVQADGKIYLSTNGSTANKAGSGFSYTPGNDFTFNFTIDIATGEASLSINGETAQTATGCSLGTAFSGIVFNTGSGAMFNNYVKNLTMTYTPATTVEKVTKTINLAGESQTVTLTNAADASDVVTITASGDVQLTSGATYNVTVPTGYTVSPTTITGNDTAETITVSVEDTTAYAEMGTYLFGTSVTTGDYNITSKTLQTNGNVTTQFRDMQSAAARTRKNDGNNNITLTLKEQTSVTIASSGKGIVAVDSTTGTEYTFEVGTNTIELPAGSYTIMGADTGSNSEISSMILAPVNTSATACTITGKVVDGDGNPVAGATILLNGASTGVTTGDDGSYTIDAYTSTEYTVTATKTGYNNGTATVTTTDVESASNSVADIELGWAGTVTVNVTLDGEVASDITVNIVDEAGNSYDGVTDANGVATFTGLAPGTYTITADGYTQTTTATVAVNSNPTVDLALETAYYTYTVNVVNTDTSSDRSITLTDPKGNSTVYTATANSTTAVINGESIIAGTWTASTGNTGVTLDTYSFNVTADGGSTTITMTIADGTLSSITGTYDFSTDAYTGYFATEGSNASHTGSAYKIVQGSYLYFNVDGTKNVQFDFSSKNMQLEMLVDGTWTVVSTLTRPQATATLTAGQYRMTAASGGGSGLVLTKVTVLEEDNTSATLTLNVTNNTGNPITVTVAGSVEGSQEVSGTTAQLTFTGLGTGDHAITVTGTGAVDGSIDKVTVTKGMETLSADLTVETIRATKITFAWDTVSGVNPDKSVSISGAGSGTLSTSATSISFENITPGEVFYFKSDSTKVTSLAKGTSNEDAYVSQMQIGFDQSSNRRFVFEVPNEDTLAEEYIIYFVTSDAYNKPAEGDRHTSTAAVSYNQYGFGGDKYYLCGNNGRMNLTYVSNAACIRDFNNGYSDANSGKFADYILNGSKFMATTVGTSGDTVTEERWRDYGYVLINSSGNSYIEFTTGEIEANTRLLIDSSLVGASGTKYTVTPSGGSALSSQGTSGTKDIYYIQPNTTYRIVGGNSSVSTYIKSIRTFNPNNIFNKAVGSNGDVTATPYQAGNINGDLLDALNISSGENRAVLRLIGEVAPSNVQAVAGSLSSALNDIKSVGWKVMPKAPVDAFNTQHNKYTFTPEQWGSMTEEVGGTDYRTDKATLETWFKYTSNEFDTTELINTGVMKLTTDANPSATSYDDVHYVNHTSEITAADLLIGDIDATKSDKAYTVAYSERFITLPDGEYYIFPYTVYSIGSDAEVYSQVPTSVAASQENWEEYTRVVEVSVSGGIATVIN